MIENTPSLLQVILFVLCLPARWLWFVFPDLVLFLISCPRTLHSCQLLPLGSPSLRCGVSVPSVLSCSKVRGRWGRSLSSAKNGAVVAWTDLLNSFFQIVVHLYSGHSNGTVSVTVLYSMARIISFLTWKTCGWCGSDLSSLPPPQF